MNTTIIISGMKIDKEKLYKLYMNWVDDVTESCDWKTSFDPEEIVNSIGNIIENNPDLVVMRPIKEIKYNMEELYNYVLWYNHYNETWYGIPTNVYVEFKSGDYLVEGLKIAKSYPELLNLICG